jgi:excisionase family DNA binding protein
MDTRLLTAKEMARYLATTPAQIYQMVSRRQIPFVKIGRSTRFDRLAIDEWIKKRAVPDGVRGSGSNIRFSEGKSYRTEK